MSLYQKASLVQIPSGYKAADDKLYSVVPNNGDGDFTVTVDADATRVNKDGLIESVVADQARLNYDPTNPQDPHLLLEPSRTNNILQSNDPSGANWTDPLSRWTLLSDTTTAPDGGTVRIIELTESGGSLIRLTGFSIAAGTYTLSFYIKDIDGNLTGGSVDIGDEGSGAPSPAFGDVGSDWVRATRTITTTATKSHMDLQPTFSGSTNKVAIWGVQLEAGSYATSLIPTSGFAVTRTVDNIDNIGGVTVNSDFTYFLHIKNFDDKTLGNFPVQFFLRESASPFSYFRFLLEGNERFYAQLRNNNTATTVFNQFSDTLSNLGDDIKLAFAKSGTNCKYYVNGSLAFSSTITDFNYSFDRVNYSTGNDQPTKLSQIMVFNEALSDSELQTLTS